MFIWQDDGDNGSARDFTGVCNRRRNACAGYSQGTRRTRVTHRELLRLRREHWRWEGLSHEPAMIFLSLRGCRYR